jgi:hypothetical protein
VYIDAEHFCTQRGGAENELAPNFGHARRVQPELAPRRGVAPAGLSPDHTRGVAALVRNRRSYMMDMRMEIELLAPGMQHTEEVHLRAEKFRL